MDKLQQDPAEMTADLKSKNLQLSIISQHINHYDRISKLIQPGDVMLPGAAASEIISDTNAEDGESSDEGGSESGSGDDNDESIDGEGVHWDPDDPCLYS